MKHILQIMLALLLPNLLFGQMKTIKGKVSTLEHLAYGVTITNKTQKSTTTSNKNGSFEINAELNDVLIFSHVSLISKEITIKKDTKFIELTLEPNVQILSDLIVTGALGIKKDNRELGTSAKVVDNKLLNQGAVINPLNGLASKVAGLRVNVIDSKVDPQIQITLRGTRSLNRGKNEPMYVLDGIPVPNINRLNPNDIESITVLKGANAAALYGYEGVNGAIMITTKTGEVGKPKIQLNSTTTFSNVMLLPPAQNKFGQGTNGIYNATQYESWGPAYDNSLQAFGRPLPDGTQPELNYSPSTRDGRLNIFQTGVTQQSAISIAGGNKISSYFASAQYVNSNGIIQQDRSNRLNLRFNGKQQFNKLQTSYNLSYSNIQNNFTPDGPWQTAYTLPSNFPYSQMKDWRNPNAIGNPNNFFTDLVKNPYFLIENYRNSTSRIFPPTQQNILNIKTELNYKFSHAFSALYRIGTYQDFADHRATVGKFEAAGRRNVNGSVTDLSNNFSRWNSDFILNFQKEIKDYGIKAVLGNNIRIDNRKSISLGSSNLLLADLFNPDSRLGELNGGSSITQYRSYSFYGEITNSYKNYVYLTLTGRNDNVSVLSPKNRSYFYPGVSLSFILSDAIPNFKSQNWINFAKLYSSYNKTGNVTLNPYSLNNNYSQNSGFPFGNLVGFSPSSTNPNPDLKPEFVTSYETGLQLGLFNNRLNLDLAYTYSNSDGQIFNAPQSRATGYDAAYVNAGTLTNSIWEFTGSGDIIKNSNTTLSLNATFSYINNQVKSLYGDLEFYPIFRQSFAVKGQQYPTLRVSDYERDPNGNVVVNANTGKPIVSNELTNLGTMVPPFMAGLGLQLQHKNFAFGLQIDSRMGSWLYSEIVPRMYSAGTHPATVAFDRQAFVWPSSVVKNSDGTYSANNTVIENGGQRAFWVTQGAVQRNTAAKGDFIKLRELSMSYTLPQKWFQRSAFIQELRIGMVANNLLLIRHKSNTMGDPEYLYNSTDGYLSFRQIPPVRTYGFNLNVTF